MGAPSEQGADPILSTSALPMPPVEASLWHDRAALLGALGDRGVGIRLSDGSHAQTFNELLPDGRCISFVLMEAVEGTSLSDQLSLLAHEAVHIAYRYMECIGEEEPGEETMAYVVEAVVSILAEQHIAWLAETGRWPAAPEVDDKLKGVLR